jgi:hypothetical protein
VWISASISATSEEIMQQIPPIRLLNNGETYVINRAVNTANPTQQTNEEHDCSDIDETEMEPTETNDMRNNTNIDLSHQNESCKIVTPNKKRKITTNTNARRAAETERQQWLQEIPLQNSFSALPQEKESDQTVIPKIHNAKPPPI